MPPFLSDVQPPVWAALVAAIAVVLGYLLNARISRLRERERYFADALLATEQYKQLAFQCHRLGRDEMTKKIGEVHEQLAYHRRWLRLNSHAVAAHYRNLVVYLRNREFFREKGPVRQAPPRKLGITLKNPVGLEHRDSVELPLEKGSHTKSKHWRNACITAMDRKLRIVPLSICRQPRFELRLFSQIDEEHLEEARKFYRRDDWSSDSLPPHIATDRGSRIARILRRSDGRSTGCPVCAAAGRSAS